MSQTPLPPGSGERSPYADKAAEYGAIPVRPDKARENRNAEVSADEGNGCLAWIAAFKKTETYLSAAYDCVAHDLDGSLVAAYHAGHARGTRSRRLYEAGAASRQGEVNRLREAVKRYGGHDRLCEAYFHDDRVCDCGWVEAQS